MNPRPTTDEPAGRDPLPPILVPGRRLFFARVACAALTALTVGLFFVSIPAAYEQLSTVCQGQGECDYAQLLPKDAKALEGLGGPGFYAAYHVVLALALALGFWVIGTILFWKSPGHRLALYASVALVTFGTMQADNLYWLADAYPRLELLVNLVNFVGNASFFVLFCVFPDGRFVPRWTRWAAVAWITYWLLGSFFPESPVSPTSWPIEIDASLFLALIGSLVVAQIYRYRRVSGPVERQQTKWVVYGFTVWIAVFILVQFLVGWIFALTLPGIPQVFYDLVRSTVVVLSTLLIPLSIGVAILHYHLWDIDLIIKRSLVIGPLATILTVVFELASQLLLPYIFQFVPALDDSPTINTVVSVVIVVALFKPLRARLEAGVNRLVDRLFGGDRTSESLRREEDTFISPPAEQ